MAYQGLFLLTAIASIAAVAFADDVLPGFTCQTNLDCPGSYCMNYEPHTPPFFCQMNATLECADYPVADLSCENGGAKIPVGCSADPDCPAGSYCLNFPPHKPPFMCQSQNKPICKCDCTLNWVGTECKTWNGTVGPVDPGEQKKFDQFFTNLAAVAKEEVFGHRPGHMPVLDLGLASQYNALTNSIIATDQQTSAIGLNFSQANMQFGYIVPNGVTVKRNFDADGRPTSFSSDNKGYLGFTDWLQTFEQAYQPAVSGTPTFFTPKQTDVNMNSIASGFKGTTSSTLSTLFISAFEGSVSNPSVQLFVPSATQSALASLPTFVNCSSSQAAYESMAKIFGTHYLAGTHIGAAIQVESQWDYTLYDYRGISLDSLTSYGAADFTNATGLNLQGQPASPPSLPSEYLRGRSGVNMVFKGGNPTLMRKEAINDYLKSLSTPFYSVPINVQLEPIGTLSSDSSRAAAINTNFVSIVKQNVQDWIGISSCPPCQWGTCSNPRDVSCTCSNGNVVGRTCAQCKDLWEGNACLQAMCINPGCNTAHGKCVAPNTCQCTDHCYDGPDCTHFTCPPHHNDGPY